MQKHVLNAMLATTIINVKKQSYLKNKDRSNPSIMKWLLIAVLLIAVIVSGCTENYSIYSVDQVYQNPDSLKNKKGEWNTVTIQGIAGTDPIYEAGNSNGYYYLAPESKNYPAYEIIYVSTINGAPDPGNRVTVKGKIDKAVDAGKIRIITFNPTKQ
ncbi:MAG TPA: hypothetical protein VN368_01155 [Candidatus Methylomirabilis sp.]|nr:hypothetical protein [Candidatus Methylomirabilis sp.]